MKRFLILLIAVMLLGLTACGTTADEPAKHTLEFAEGKTTTMNETEYVAVFCNYTNNSGETCIPCDEINVKAFQNGVELKVVVYTGQKTEDAIQCDTSVQTDTTAKVVWLFEKQDNSTVSVEFTDGQKHSFEIKAE